MISIGSFKRRHILDKFVEIIGDLEVSCSVAGLLFGQCFRRQSTRLNVFFVFVVFWHRRQTSVALLPDSGLGLSYRVTPKRRHLTARLQCEEFCERLNTRRTWSREASAV